LFQAQIADDVFQPKRRHGNRRRNQDAACALMASIRVSRV
jgi:hypothetical protein